MGSPPLTEPVLLILLSLAEQPRHGYAILKDVEEMSNGRVKLSTGTLYGALCRMLEEGWIERFRENDATRGRQAYCLSRAGRRNLQFEVSRLKQLSRLASMRVARKET
ncbi:MAG TPA: helix-turn-helix transcriptional regulator [Candidatus Acidoferrum sp.]|nr:helix-turn-helix transcriptional regulator [Candidatus Acidoferrum sp.]